jgi:hypothetical protein
MDPCANSLKPESCCPGPAETVPCASDVMATSFTFSASEERTLRVWDLGSAGKAIAPYGRPLYRLRFLPLILQSSKMEMAHINCRSARSTANEALRRSRQAVPDERS